MTNEQRYYPLHVVPYTPGCRLPGGKQDPAFHTKPRLARNLIERAKATGIAFKAIVADSAYGDNRPFVRVLNARHWPYVLAHSGKVGRGWAPSHLAHSFEDAARELPLRAWQRIARRFRKYGPHGPIRAICATTDRRTLPDLNTWYLTTTLSEQQTPLAEVVRLYGLRNWIEQSYKQMKDELGWADFMVRSDLAIRRHWILICCAFAFCWWHEAYEAHEHEEVTPQAVEKKQARPTSNPMLLAAAATVRSGMDDPGTLAHVLLGGLFEQAPSARDRRNVSLPHVRLWN